jgi:hypothetical protein
VVTYTVIFNKAANYTEATSLDWKSQCLENPSVFHYYGLLMRNREYIEFETLKKQCWSYLRNIKTAINYFFYKRFAQNLAKFLLSKNLAERWDLPNTGIFYSKDVASLSEGEVLNHFYAQVCATVSPLAAISGNLSSGHSMSRFYLLYVVCLHSRTPHLIHKQGILARPKKGPMGSRNG